jgi:branched-chain amino acid aminotransferase
METTKYIWMDGEFVEWERAQVHVLTHTLHYGSGAFEGIRAYQTDHGPAIFRLPEHIDRLFYSAAAIGMHIPHTKETVANACCECISKNGLQHGYIRPLAYYGYGVMGVHPKNAPVRVMVACWPWGAYLPHDSVDIKISRYLRIHPGTSRTDAKICGHYVNSLMAVLEVRSDKYHEALMLDTNGHIAEGPGENFFMVKNGRLLTPRLGSILAGITRATVIQIARDLGFEVLEQEITPEAAFAADEAFFTGTATEVAPIRSIDDRLIGGGKIGPVTAVIKESYLNAVYGRSDKYGEFLTYCS